jgi:organic hydroperoxide reductase OsmC/OhrA
MSINVLYTAHATAVGGRNGRTRSDDGLVDVQLSIPKAPASRSLRELVDHNKKHPDSTAKSSAFPG